MNDENVQDFKNKANDKFDDLKEDTEEAIEKAKVKVPVIRYEIIIVAMVPTTLQLTVLTKLLFNFSSDTFFSVLKIFNVNLRNLIILWI